MSRQKDDGIVADLLLGLTESENQTHITMDPKSNNSQMTCPYHRQFAMGPTQEKNREHHVVTTVEDVVPC